MTTIAELTHAFAEAELARRDHEDVLRHLALSGTHRLRRDKLRELSLRADALRARADSLLSKAEQLLHERPTLH